MCRRKKSGLLAVGCLLSAFGDGSALAGSVLQPGATIGLPVGVPFAEGIYVINTSSYGQRSATNAGLEINLTQVTWATPFFVDDTRLQFFILQPSTASVNNPESRIYFNSTLYSVQLAHTFGNGLNAAVVSGYRTGMPSPLAYHDNSLEERAALSYDAFGYDLTANVIGGLFYGRTGTTTYPNWLNLDLTATRYFGDFEFGAVAFGSSDISRPTPTYLKQRQFAVGGLAGYRVASLKFQLMLTRDVTEQHYAGYDTRGWVRVVIPLYEAKGAPEPPITRF